MDRIESTPPRSPTAKTIGYEVFLVRLAKESGIASPTNYMKQAKKIVLIENAPTAARFIQVTTLLSDEELERAKLERPDLIFKLQEELPSEGDFVPLDEDESNTTGMMLPHNLNDLINQVFEHK